MEAATIAVWGGEDASHRLGHSTQVAIVPGVAFGYDDLEEWRDVALGRAPGHIYSRNSNPTVAAFEGKVRELEGAEAATSFSTGMAAISAAFFTFLRPGDRLVSTRDSYGGTHKLFTEFLPAFGIEVKLCETHGFEEIEREVARGCRVLYLETPTNPTLKVVDIARLARAAHASGALVVVDNTVATPINQNPLALGADVVIHSATKFLGGHADALGGIACGGREPIARIHHFREITGASLSPMDAYALLRGMKTLALRIERQNDNAMAVARWLSRHPAVDAVNYPGLESHEQFQLARAQMRGCGGMLSFSVRGGIEAIGAMLPRLRLAHRAANLGSVETVVGPPAVTSHVECTVEERRAAGIPEGLVRYSAGIEASADLIADLEQALSVLA